MPVPASAALVVLSGTDPSTGVPAKEERPLVWAAGAVALVAFIAMALQGGNGGRRRKSSRHRSSWR